MSKPLTALVVSDLILGEGGFGTPWSVMHCGQLAAAVLARPKPNGMGFGLGPSEVWTACGVVDAQARFDGVLASGSWVEVDAASELGDVIVSIPRDGPSALHFSIVCELGARMMAVTTSEKTGVIMVPVDIVANVTSVYRWAA